MENLMWTSPWMQIDGKWSGGEVNLEYFRANFECSPESNPMTGKDSLPRQTREKIWKVILWLVCRVCLLSNRHKLFTFFGGHDIACFSRVRWKDDNYGLKANACWQLSWHNSKAVIVFITFPSRSLGLSARLLNINYRRRRRRLITVSGEISPESRKVKEKVLWFGKALPSEKLKAQSIGSEPPCNVLVVRKSSETALSNEYARSITKNS